MNREDEIAERWEKDRYLLRLDDIAWLLRVVRSARSLHDAAVESVDKKWDRTTSIDVLIIPLLREFSDVLTENNPNK